MFATVDAGHNLVKLKVKYALLSVGNLNPMPMLTSLTLELISLEDEHLNELNKCFPNLQVLNLRRVVGLENPRIHLLNLKTCCWAVRAMSSLTLITPNLITLRIESLVPIALHVDAPMLSHFHCKLDHPDSFTVKKLKNLKRLLLESINIGSLLPEFPVTDALENLTLVAQIGPPRAVEQSKFTLEKVFTVFPNVSSLCIDPNLPFRSLFEPRRP